MAKPSGIDWMPIKTEYITTSIGLRELAKKHGIGMSSISKRCKTEQWVEQRETYQNKCVAKATQKCADKEVDRLARLITATTKAIDVAMEAFEDDKQFNRYIISEGLGGGATETAEREFRKIDTKALKELTGVIKDLTALMRDFYDLPTPARAEAQRIAAARLALEQRKAESDEEDVSGVEVVFADGMEKYTV